MKVSTTKILCAEQVALLHKGCTD